MRVLLVEDDKIDQLAFKRLVREAQLPYEYIIAGSVETARKILASESFDIVIMDYLLGDGTAFDLLDSVVGNIPVIVTTGSGDEEIAVRAMKAGADDYLIKDLERNYLTVLPVTIEQTIKHRKDQQAVRQLREAMVHTMVHDLRNPLGAIFTALEFIAADAVDILSPDHSQALQIASNNAQKMLALINAILDVSRLESGHMPVDRAAIALEELVAEVLRSQSPLAEDKGLHLESQVPHTLPLAFVDPQLIARVLQNLVDNAIKFTPEGGTIQIMAKIAENEHSKIWVTVSDTGPGIPAEIKAQLFQKFVTGRQPGRGSGLGLAFCKLAVEAHGGQIWVESNLEQGTAFTFSLDMAEVPSL